MNMRDEVVVILAAIVTGALFWALCGKATWFIGHDDGQAYERYMESMMENGMCPDIYGYGRGDNENMESDTDCHSYDDIVFYASVLVSRELWAGRRWEHDVYEIGDIGKRIFRRRRICL